MWSNVVDAQTMTDAVSTLDIDLDGNTVTSAMPVTTFPSNQSYAEAGGVWRGDGFLTQVEYGPNPNMTVRLVQDCVP